MRITALVEAANQVVGGRFSTDLTGSGNIHFTHSPAGDFVADPRPAFDSLLETDAASGTEEAPGFGEIRWGKVLTDQDGAEDGDHQQLIAEGGLYAKLYGHLQH